MVTRPNYLAAWMWGVHPPSARRRRRALACYLVPTLLYLALIGAGALFFVVVDSPDWEMHNTDWKAYFSQLLLFSWGLGFLFCLVLPFRMENRRSNARLLQANLHDYRLTGLSGREILTGLAAPQLAAHQLFIKTYAVVMMVWVAILAPFSVVGLLVAILLAISWLASYFNLVYGGRYNLSLWPTTPSRVARALKTAALIFTCPLTLCTICPLLVFLALILLPFGIAVVVVRGTKAADAWADAQAALDGVETVSLRSPVQDAPDDKTIEPGLRATP